MNPDELPSVGDTLAGKYQLTRELGRGGMGAVYEATQIKLARSVAIKVVLPEVARRPELAYRFEHEARAAAKLRGRHAVHVLDVDTTPEGLPYLVMELLEGHSLRDELKQRGPLPVDEAVHYVREACEGVDEAHRAGIIHRDLKPANLFLSKEPEGFVVVKVVDFGIAKATDIVDAAYHTATNMPLGTYKYMSPEQARSPRSVDVRTDVWSLGVVLYQLLSGKTPFHGEGALGVVYAIATQAPPPLRAMRPDVPEALAAIIERALCKELEGRYQTMRELADALVPFDPSVSLLPARSPSFPLLTPVLGSPRYAASGSLLTPALGLTPRSVASDLGSAPTLGNELTPASLGEADTPLAEPAPPKPSAPSLTRSEGAPHENDLSVAKSHVVPIKPKGLAAASTSASRWLAVASLVLFGGSVAVLQTARTHSDVSTLNSASLPRATPTENVPTRATAAAREDRNPPKVTPTETLATATPEAPSKAENGRAAPAAPNASAAHPGAKPTLGKAARPGKTPSEPAASPATSAPKAPPPKAPAGLDIVDD